MRESLFAELGQRCIVYGGIFSLACLVVLELVPQDIEDKQKVLHGIVGGIVLVFMGLIMMSIGAFDYLW